VCSKILVLSEFLDGCAGSVLLVYGSKLFMGAIGTFCIENVVKMIKVFMMCVRKHVNKFFQMTFNYHLLPPFPCAYRNTEEDIC